MVVIWCISLVGGQSGGGVVNTHARDASLKMELEWRKGNGE